MPVPSKAVTGAPGLEPGTFGFGDRRTTNCAILPNIATKAERPKHITP